MASTDLMTPRVTSTASSKASGLPASGGTSSKKVTGNDGSAIFAFRFMTIPDLQFARWGRPARDLALYLADRRRSDGRQRRGVSTILPTLACLAAMQSVRSTSEPPGSIELRTRCYPLSMRLLRVATRNSVPFDSQHNLVARLNAQRLAGGCRNHHPTTLADSNSPLGHEKLAKDRPVRPDISRDAGT